MTGCPRVLSRGQRNRSGGVCLFAVWPMEGAFRQHLPERVFEGSGGGVTVQFE